MAEMLSLHATDAPIVMALHGSAAHPSQWVPLAKAAAHRCDVRAEVMPGYHGRAVASDMPRGLARRAAPLIAELEKCHQPVHLVGHSFGGAVAVKVAAMRPDLVASLTLYEPVLPTIVAQDPTPWEHRAVGALKSVGIRLAAAIASGFAEQGVAGFIDFWNGDGAWRAMPDGLRAALVMQAMDILSDYDDLMSDDLDLESLGEIEIPTLILSGSRTQAVARVVADRVLAQMPQAMHMELEGLGHMAPVTDPGEVDPWILRHVTLCAGTVVTPMPEQRAA